jgi:hypothetical protein
MKKLAAGFGLLALAGVVIILYWLAQSPPQETVIDSQPQNVSSEKTIEEEQAAPTPDEAPPASALTPLYVFLTRNQLEFQVAPQKSYNIRKREEFEHRFQKLVKREQQLGIPIEQGNPLVLAPPQKSAN